MLTRDSLLKAVRKELRKWPSEVYLRELTCYFDEEFIDNAFRAILHREPDPAGKSFYLSRLRNGELTKEDIVISLRYSEEGKRVGVNVVGLKKYILLNRLLSVPGLKKFFYRLKSAIYALRFPGVLAQYEEQILRHRKNVEEFKRELHKLADSYAALNKLIHERLLISTTFMDLTPEEYVKFEEKFRGSIDETKGKLRRYLQILTDITEKFKGEDLKIVDLGCGRGEWLEILREEGAEPIGVDLNEVFVNTLLERGFKVFKEDIFDFLRHTEDNSLHMITAFHLVEHIDVKRRAEFLREALRVLKSGGVLIIETPNPRNILVGSSDFYRDPSHITPLFPDTLQYIGEIIGFSKSTSFFISSKGKLVEIDKFRFDSLEDYISVSRDFAWIGVK